MKWDACAHFMPDTHTLCCSLHQSLPEIVCARACVCVYMCVCPPPKVQYTSEGFLEKNRDSLPNGAVGLMQSSTNDLIRSIFLGR